jgi:hypothetical protein
LRAVAAAYSGALSAARLFSKREGDASATAGRARLTEVILYGLADYKLAEIIEFYACREGPKRR